MTSASKSSELMGTATFEVENKRYNVEAATSWSWSADMTGYIEGLRNPEVRGRESAEAEVSSDTRALRKM